MGKHKTAGKSDREGISMVELFNRFPDDATAEAWFVSRRWPEGIHCPHCGSCNVQTGAKHKTMPYRCREKECGKRFSTKTGTVMEASKLGFQVWAIATYLLSTSLKSVSSMKLHRDLNINQRSAWFLAHRLREALSDREGPFEGPLEADEAYFGGKRANMSNAKRKELADTGRGAVGKTAVVGVKDRATNRVAASVVPSTTGEILQGFVRAHAEEGAMIYTDEASAYAGLAKSHGHEAVNHGASEYVRGMAHTNGMESFWSMLKRADKGTFHKMSPKHLDRYVQEFAGKHNVRDMDTIDIMTAFVTGAVGKRLRYRELIADNGLPSGARSA
ncbi:MAG: IS1595 family transposase [Alphaproteobacteria bacterium]|nr:IS1595 family transposase [Alphaproteobacteria bacterium]